MAYITDSWEDIEKNCAAGIADLVYSIGDLKTITLNWGSTTEDIDLEIIGFSHDDLADGTGKATITFFSKQLLATSQKMASNNANTGGWAGSYSLRNWCNSTLFAALPSDLQAVIREVTKLSDGGQNSTALVETRDKCWLASVEELSPYNIANVTILTGQGTAYAGIGAAPTRAKVGGDAISWWTRTTTRYENKWFFIGQWGGASYDNAANEFGVAFGLCVGAVDTQMWKTKGERLARIAHHVRRITGTTGNMSAVQIEEKLADVPPVAFATSASGCLPEVVRGTASSEFTLTFETSATGALQEG